MGVRKADTEAGDGGAALSRLPQPKQLHRVGQIEIQEVRAGRGRQIKEFTRAAWAKAKAKEKLLAQAA